MQLFGTLLTVRHLATIRAGGDAERPPPPAVDIPARLRRLDRLLVAGAVLGALYLVAFTVAMLVIPPNSLAARVLVDLVYPVPEAVAVVLLFVAARHSSRVRWFWYVLSIGMLMGLVGTPTGRCTT